MICAFCSKNIAPEEEPTIIKHLSLALPFGPRDTTGLDLVNLHLCGPCSDTLLRGLRASRAESAKIRQQTREQSLIAASKLESRLLDWEETNEYYQSESEF